METFCCKDSPFTLLTVFCASAAIHSYASRRLPKSLPLRASQLVRLIVLLKPPFSCKFMVDGTWIFRECGAYTYTHITQYTLASGYIAVLGKS